MRAQSILLSAQGQSIHEIASISPVDRDTVSAWLPAWEHRGLHGWYDQPRSGRPAKRTPEEQALALDSLNEDPRGFKRVAARLMTQTDKRISLSVLTRLAKKARLRWKRVRTSGKDNRDPAAFARCQRELRALQEQHKRGEIGLYYFAEAGFALDPCIPYAWQHEGEVREVPAWQRGRVNVWGVMTTDNDLPPCIFAQSVNRAVVVACVDVFWHTIEQKTVVVMDNASMHRSEEFAAHLLRWKKRGLCIKFLPEYSPERNLIEILWRKITYEWLPFSAYHGLTAMIEALEDILRKFGAEYQITFA
jgi:transposase